MQLPAPTDLRAVVDAPSGMYMTIFYVFIALVFGAYATSAAEYLLQYNLVDLTLDKIKAIFGTVEKDAKTAEQKLLDKFKKL